MPTLRQPDGKELRLYHLEEDDFGAAVSGGDYIPTVCYSFGLRPARPLEADNLLGETLTTVRDPGAPAPGLTDVSGQVVVPLDFRHIGYWLKLLFGAPVTTGSATYAHVFTSGGVELPTWHLPAPIGTARAVHSGVAAKTIQFQLGQEAGYRRATIALMGKDTAYPSSFDLGTTPAMLARAPFAASKGVLAIGGEPVANLLGFDGTYDNMMEAERFVDGSDTVSGFAPGSADPSFTGSLRLRWLDRAYEELALAGAASAMTITYQTSSSLKLVLSAPATYFERGGPEIGGPGRIEQTVGFRCAQSASAAMLTATLTNDVAAY
ncbi:phage tail tube protein [Methylobrevis pamukkalensis]|uniref:Phage tail protein n=1 Tax=Methylobrevis pamukkalensis TaxID=1439726 RepID=A0A1E3H1K5_9HYPH|nr:phage tail tube protein [Methylobrevis pamukkalensis]ODN70218.1 hypothetical protein A6302_02492 [Methylobrevis pamukkalensis]